MKKSLVLLLVLIMLFSVLVSCGPASENEKSDAAETEAPTADAAVPAATSDPTADSSIQNSHQRDIARLESGSNYWGDSNLRSWLNSNKPAGEVVWLDNNPPEAYRVEAGFLHGFSAEELDAIKKAEYQYCLFRYDEIGEDAFDYKVEGAYQDAEGNYFENLVDMMTLLSQPAVEKLVTEFEDELAGYATSALAAEWGVAEDEIIPWLSMATYDGQGGASVPVVNGRTDSPFDGYWTNSPGGVRPVFYLKDVGLSGSGSLEDPFVLSGEGKIAKSDYLQLGSYNGEPIIWRCIEVDGNGALMLAHRVLTVKSFDDPGSNTGGHSKYLFEKD